MSSTNPWYDGITPEQQTIAATLVSLVQMGVTYPETVSREYCDALVRRCSAALDADPNLLNLVGYLHGVTCGEVIAEFDENGPTQLARRWLGVGDRLQELTGMNALGGP